MDFSWQEIGISAGYEAQISIWVKLMILFSILEVSIVSLGLANSAMFSRNLLIFFYVNIYNQI
jgi:hypothetical protein